ncbi:isoleucyl-tRNA synthetase [Candidatus Defluviicoccus seviourii]|uniref:Isoleucine--tRNA ligase n=1 Tax=Candidatus Defluviicoccus seviourii TaxID=2565273 RepID=A0A564WG38_9PROT|nr:isoleucyl-tRNA synthetase [Candidatus Defluviicoccus seviourii]
MRRWTLRRRGPAAHDLKQKQIPVNYKSTIFLPRTDFPMKANLPKREPEMLARWQDSDLYGRLRRQSAGREKFILHDGPPYANGHLHIGHALNKILKDVINRSQQMLGKDAPYVPGWDCHGLPIEWKIEERYREGGRNKDAVPVVEFRRECREFAQTWIDIQREEFRRLGIEGDWAQPYSTMTFAAEAAIVRELGRFLMSGALFRGAKPVLWSVVERTALAEAEVEYHDHTSTTIFVAFPVVTPACALLADASVVIWTTTPWTIPGNRAIAYGDDVPYGVFEVTDPGACAAAVAGTRVVVAEALAARLQAEARIGAWSCLGTLPGSALAGTVCRHPLAGRGYDFEVPLLPAHFVDIETGSGFVHIAPSHGADDWELGQRHGLPVPDLVGGDGIFLDHVPLFAGRTVLTPAGKDGDANGAVLAALGEAKALLATGKLVHSYPHSWRSKAPLIFRNTPQWFISMERTGLRESALAAVDATRFVPKTGQNRLRGMIETRPDWCISRQRAWGVPIAVFVEKKTGAPLRDAAVMERIVAAFAAEGADAWFASDPSRFLGPEHDPADYEQVTDILDVWFDSGCTHSFVLEQRGDLAWPASLYLEGSDQHRGWFHSSLLESCGTRGRAPYDAVLTHGFVMAEDGQKMSKSLGNVVSPQDVIESHGADVLRLWVLASDYSSDLRIGPEILKQQADIYRRIRNTLRFLLGNLDDFEEWERLSYAELPELERWVLHRLTELDAALRQACNDLLFHPLFAELHAFCTVDLSALYFDVRKDSLYCDAADSLRRRAARTVLERIFDCLTAWLAPFLCFTAEEAWLARPGGGDGASVHERLFPVLPQDWRDDALAGKWEIVRRLRRVVTGAIEVERAANRLGASLQAHPVIYANEEFRQAAQGIDLAELCITSAVELTDAPAPENAYRLPDVEGVAVVVQRARGEKCERCWQVLPEVGTIADVPGVCGRCADAVRRHLAAAE